MEITITSPDDWPEGWREMRDIDTLLRCSICCEFMETAMTLSKCSHSYCSLCIRRSICYKTQCPTCFVAAIESDLVNNRSLNEVIQKFSLVRKRLLECITSKVPSTSQAKNQTSNDVKPVNTQPQEKSTVSTLWASSSKTCTTQPFEKTLKTTPKPDGKNHIKKNPRFRTVKRTYTESDETDESSTDGDSDVTLEGLTQDTSDEDFRPEEFSPRMQAKKRKIKLSKRSPKSREDRTDKSQCTEQMTHSDRVDIPISNNEPLPELLTLSKLSSCSTPRNAGKSPSGFDKVEPSLTSPKPFSSFSSPSTSKFDDRSAGSSPGPSNTPTSVARVPCPVCGVEVPQKHINLHLDRCLTNKDKREAPPPPPKRKQMPKLVYNLLKDKDLKKKCAEIGLNTDGDRKTLTKRHHDFTLLYNSQCDSANPKSAVELVKQIQKNEQAKSKGLLLTKSKPIHKLVIQKNASSDDVQTAQKEYAVQHKSQFDKLIEEARKRRLLKKSAMEAKQETEDTSKDVKSIAEPGANNDSSPKPSTSETIQNMPSDCEENIIQEPSTHGASFDEADAKALPFLPSLDINTNKSSRDINISSCTAETNLSGIKGPDLVSKDKDDEVPRFFWGDSENDGAKAASKHVNNPVPSEATDSAETIDPTAMDIVDDGPQEVNTNMNNANEAVSDDSDATEPLNSSCLQVSVNTESDSELFSSPDSPSLLAPPSKSYLEDVDVGTADEAKDTFNPVEMASPHSDTHPSEPGVDTCIADTLILTGSSPGSHTHMNAEQCQTRLNDTPSTVVHNSQADVNSHPIVDGTGTKNKARGRPKKTKVTTEAVAKSHTSTIQPEKSSLVNCNTEDYYGDFDLEMGSPYTPSTLTSESLPGSPRADISDGAADGLRRSSRPRKRPRHHDDEQPVAAKRSKKQTAMSEELVCENVTNAVEPDLAESTSKGGKRKGRGKKK